MTMTAAYRGYGITVRPTRCAYMTVWVYRVTYTSGKRVRVVAEGDGGFTADSAVRAARSAIDRL